MTEDTKTCLALELIREGFAAPKGQQAELVGEHPVVVINTSVPGVMRKTARGKHFHEYQADDVHLHNQDPIVLSSLFVLVSREEGRRPLYRILRSRLALRFSPSGENLDQTAVLPVFSEKEFADITLHSYGKDLS